MLKDGAHDIGGKCAVNPSGRLIAMGHDRPDGDRSIGEITMQLRGKAGQQQHRDARTAWLIWSELARFVACTYCNEIIRLRAAAPEFVVLF
jgi:acetyl-CoA acetyltransferase